MRRFFSCRCFKSRGKYRLIAPRAPSQSPRRICLGEQIAAITPVLREHAHANTGREPRISGGNRLDEFVGHPARGRVVGDLWNQHQKFIAIQTRQIVRFAKRLQHVGRRRFQQRSTDRAITFQRKHQRRKATQGRRRNIANQRIHVLFSGGSIRQRCVVMTHGWRSGLLNQFSICAAQPNSANASRAAAMVASMSASVCAADTNPASNADGARYTPRRSIAWKNLLKRSRSASITSA